MSPESPVLLIRGAEVFAPSRLGTRDVLCGGGRILAVEPSLDAAWVRQIGGSIVDARDALLVPGLIDLHVHIAGAGGEGGPETRTPEMSFEALAAAGITTAVGLLGADGITRSVESVLMKCKALRARGLSSWIWSGAYQLPVPTLSGDIGRDLVLFEEVIGAGEIAIADHRSSSPSVDELIRFAKRVRLGAMLGGKCGLVHLHLGDAPEPFAFIREVVGRSELTERQFLPTHVNRSASVLSDAIEYGGSGSVDVTASAWPFFPDEEIKPSRAIQQLVDAGVPLAQITMSSDAGGSLPSFDERGQVERLEIGSPDRMLAEVVDLIAEGFPPGEAIGVVTANPADRLGLRRKGRIRVGGDADLLLLDRDHHLSRSFARGREVYASRSS
jgi:beta-aspartyl-dipeptidase (metallo-type)